MARGSNRGLNKKEKQQVKQMAVNAVKGTAESKYHHFQVTNEFPIDNTLNSVTNVRDLSLIVQGDNNEEREGLEVYGKNLYLNYTVRPAANTTANCTYRVMVISTDLASTTWVDSRPAFNDTYNPAFLARINKVLYDRVHNTRQYAASSANRPEQSEQIKINLHGMKMRYPSNSTAQATKNSIWLLLISNEASIDQPPFMVFDSRLRFVDP